jgi:hypothetical protein
MGTSERTWASIGDRGALNTELSASLCEVWLDRDLSWLDFNDRVLAEADNVDECLGRGEQQHPPWHPPGRTHGPASRS